MSLIKKKWLSFLLIISLFIGIVGIISPEPSYAAKKSVHLKKKTVTLVAGYNYTQKLVDKNGKVIKPKRVKWKSSKKSVAVIDWSGFIEAKKAGTVKMTAKYKGKTYKFTVKVRKPYFYKHKIKPKLKKIVCRTDGKNYWFNPKWNKIKEAFICEVYVSKDGGAFKLYDDSSGNIALISNPKKECVYSVKVRAVGGKYKSGFSNIQSIILHKDGTYEAFSGAGSSLASAQKIYNYVYENGYSVNSDYLIPGNRCIESNAYSGSNYTDIYVISIDTNDKSKIYFGSYRIKPSPGKYKDTAETSVLEYSINSLSGTVTFWQVYYTSSRSSSWTHYTSSGDITYSKYSASNYENEKGITNITIGYDHTPVEVGSYDSHTLVDGIKGMTIGVDKLLNQVLNIRLRDIGFKLL